MLTVRKLFIYKYVFIHQSDFFYLQDLIDIHDDYSLLLLYLVPH